MVKIKICGITNIDDARDVYGLGADAIGFIFAESPRRVSKELAKEIIAGIPLSGMTRVGVFVNEDPYKVNKIREECGLDLVQLHGDEDAGYCEKMSGTFIKTFRIRDLSDLSGIKRSLSAILESRAGKFIHSMLLDTYSSSVLGGTGRVFDWAVAKKASGLNTKIILSGGINPSNIRNAIDAANPYAVDISSGVEISSGKKDREKIKIAVEIAHGGCIMSVRGL